MNCVIFDFSHFENVCLKIGNKLNGTPNKLNNPPKMDDFYDDFYPN